LTWICLKEHNLAWKASFLRIEDGCWQMKKGRKKTLTVIIKQHGDEAEALCLDLDIAASGGTEKEVIEVLRDLIELYLNDCEKSGQSPWRPVPTEALEEFLAPPKPTERMPFSSRQIPIPSTSHALI
jgi:hypothetical protein